MDRYRLPDLLSAIQEYYHGLSSGTSLNRLGPVLSRNATAQSFDLGFDTIKMWFSMKVQTKSLFKPGETNKPITICAEPPFNAVAQHSVSDKVIWKYGRYDSALFINDDTNVFIGKANLQGMNCISSPVSH
jgi:hypothetical protein